MAVDTAPKLRRKRRAAWAIETTTGTAVTIGASTGTVPIFNPEMRYETEKVEREQQGTLAMPRQGRGARPGRFTFETELYGGVSVSANLAALFRGCGLLDTSGVYTPIDGATETLTMGLYRDGLLKKLVGCMGTFTLTLRRGQAPRIAWDFRGVQDQPSDTALIAPTYDTTIAPRVGASVFTIGGSTYRVPEIVIEFGNEVVLREDVTAVDSASEATGYRCAYITNRVTRVRCSPEALPIATIDWQDKARDATTVALAVTIGAVGNGWSIACPALQLDEDPADADREGMLTNDLVFVATNVGGSPDITLTNNGS